MGPHPHRVVDVTVIAMWAHPRAVSTAFLRMMIERGDVTVVHEPLVTLADWGEITIPGRDGATVVLREAGEVLRYLLALGSDRTVFFKDTLEYRHDVLYDHPEWTSGLTHTFIVRDPRAAIASQFALKPEMSCSDVGYEHQWQLFELARRVTGRTPVVIRAEELLAAPARVVRSWCEAVGLPYLEHALTWRPEDRPEWQRSRRWHVDASVSTGFGLPTKRYGATVDNHPLLHTYYQHNLPYYERLVRYAI